MLILPEERGVDRSLSVLNRNLTVKRLVFDGLSARLERADNPAHDQIANSYAPVASQLTQLLSPLLRKCQMSCIASI